MAETQEELQKRLMKQLFFQDVDSVELDKPVQQALLEAKELQEILDTGPKYEPTKKEEPVSYEKEVLDIISKMPQDKDLRKSIRDAQKEIPNKKVKPSVEGVYSQFIKDPQSLNRPDLLTVNAYLDLII